ncbi:MAG: hypothetical protein AMXMBFR64_45220 [Myxococcales bacterium]
MDAMTRTSRAALLTCVALFALGSSYGCGQAHPEAAAVAAVFSSLQGAIYEGDAGAVWDLSVPELHAEIRALRERIVRAVVILDDIYSAEEARVIRRDIGGDLLDGVDDDRKFFIALTAMGTLERTDEVIAGLQHDPARINGNVATIETRGGETFRFVKGADEVWRSDLALETFRTWPALKTVLANLDRVDENVAAMRRQRDLLRDPRTPEGAFNLFREALVGQNAEVVYTLITPASREVLRQFLDQWAALPEETRKAGVEGLTAACAGAAAPDVKEVKVLLRRLMDADALQEPLPLTAADRVEEVVRISDGIVDVRTTRDKTLRLVRGDKDLWRVEALDAWARSALLGPVARVAATSQDAKSP